MRVSRFAVTSTLTRRASRVGLSQWERHRRLELDFMCKAPVGQFVNIAAHSSHFMRRLTHLFSANMGYGDLHILRMEFRAFRSFSRFME